MFASEAVKDLQAAGWSIPTYQQTKDSIGAVKKFESQIEKWRAVQEDQRSKSNLGVGCALVFTTASIIFPVLLFPAALAGIGAAEYGEYKSETAKEITRLKSRKCQLGKSQKNVHYLGNIRREVQQQLEVLQSTSSKKAIDETVKEIETKWEPMIRVKRLAPSAQQILKPVRTIDKKKARIETSSEKKTRFTSILQGLLDKKGALTRLEKQERREIRDHLDFREKKQQDYEMYMNPPMPVHVPGD